MVYAAHVGSKHESESSFQNLVVHIVEVQTLGGIVLLGRNFNARTPTLLDTINTNDLYELLQAPELAKTEQPSVVAKQQNRDASVSTRVASSYTYVVTLGCLSSMAEHLVTNQGSSLV
jgi:hypothetical protein